MTSNEELNRLIGENKRLRTALRVIRDQDEPQHPTGTWARDVAQDALLFEAKVARIEQAMEENKPCDE